MTKWIRIVEDRTHGQISVVFLFSEERPTLSSRTGRRFQQIRNELNGLTDSERANVLLNLCSQEAALQPQTGVLSDPIEHKKKRSP